MSLSWLKRICLFLGVISAGVILLVGDIPSLKTPQDREQPHDTPLPLPQHQGIERAKSRSFFEDRHQVEALGTLEPLRAPVTIPFDYKGNHILVDATVNRATPSLRFILDSGMRTLIFDRRLVAPLQFIPRLQLSDQDFYGVLSQVSLDSANFNQIGAVASHFSTEGNPLQCLSDVGVLGADLMRHGVWRIDYQHQTITLASHIGQLQSSPLAVGADAFALPLQFQGHRPVVNLQIGSNPLGSDPNLQALIDTGWSGNIQLNGYDVQNYEGDPIATLATVEGQIESIQGIEHWQQTLVQIPTMHMGELTLNQFPVFLADEAIGSAQALIGNDFLQHFIVTLDWPNETLYLAPTTDVQHMAPTLPDYGFQAMLKDQRLIVTGLYHPSPIANAGVKIGDQILSINGDSYDDLAAESSCDLMQHPVGDRYHGPIAITIQRQHQIQTYHISPRSNHQDIKDYSALQAR
jgi:hypothetical protein